MIAWSIINRPNGRSKMKTKLLASQDIWVRKSEIILAGAETARVGVGLNTEFIVVRISR